MKLGTLPFSDLLEVSDDIYKNTIVASKRARQIIQKRFEKQQAEIELFDENYTPAIAAEIDMDYVEKEKAITMSVEEFLNKELEWKKQESEDRVYVSGCRGSSAPKTHKVCVNLAGGYRNGVEILLTGLDIEEKAKLVTHSIFENLGGREQFDKVDIQLQRTDKEDPISNEQAQASLRISVKSDNPELVGRMFSAKITELGLANLPGWTGRGGTPSGAYIEYWPALVDSKFIKENVYFEGKKTEIIPTSQLDFEETYYQKEPYENKLPEINKTQIIPFGRLYGTRSGDKGGCANLGVWAKTEEAYAYLFDLLTVEKLKELLPDLAEYKIDRFELPNILSLNFYVHGILQDGVSSSTRLDGQAKSLGEYLRAKNIEAPEFLIN